MQKMHLIRHKFYLKKYLELEKKLAQEVVDNFKYDPTVEKTEVEILKERITALESKVASVEKWNGRS